MRFSTALRRVTSWLALVAMLMVALAPTLSHALAGGRSDGWVRICSANGVRWLPSEAVSVEKRTPDQHHGGALDHCPFCTLHADSLPTLPAVALPPSQPVVHEAPAAFLHAPRTLHAWASAQPRAPPAQA